MESTNQMPGASIHELQAQRRRPTVVIVGGGFGGLRAARDLARYPVNIILIDRRNYHNFQPLLYQVATAGLSPAQIAVPIRWVLAGYRNIEVLLGEVVDFDLERHMVKLPELEIAYDYLIVAAGASHAYFGHDDWEPFAPGLKTLEDAVEIRRRILLSFEVAERRAASGEPKLPLNFVIVGGGPTGVELAGTLAEITRHELPHEFHHIDLRHAHVILLEGGPRILPSYSEDLSRSAEEQLRNLGVDVRTSAMVSCIEPNAVYVGETRLTSTVTLWAAGVSASPLGRKLGVPVDRAGRVQVNADLSIPGHPKAFVIGDLAALKDANGQPLPGVAPVAMQQGSAVAKNIGRDLRKQAREDFHYFDKGSLATIGRNAAIAQFGKIHISGYIAWLSWLFVHIFFLIGFQNRVMVLMQWAWSYITYERGARLITGNTSLPGWNEVHTGPQPNLERQEPVAASSRRDGPP